jgi:hypothetical protein
MYMMIEQGLRGGISMVSRRYAKANNPGMGEGKWNADKLKTYLLYLDANNLYGWAMMQYLPTGGFHWVRDEYSLNKLKNQVNNGLIKDDADEGYILRVKLRYPESLHASHTDYPLAVDTSRNNPNRLQIGCPICSRFEEDLQ